MAPSPLKAAAVLYDVLSTESAVALAAAQSFVLASGADSISQMLHGAPVDIAHVAAMATCASVFSGGLNVPWLRLLERWMPGSHASAVAAKSSADFAIAAPLVNSAYLCSVPLLTALYHDAGSTEALSASLADGLATGWTPEGLASGMLINLCTFQPYNVLQFACVPPRLRPLGGACVSATATVLLSAVTLGHTLL